MCNKVGDGLCPECKEARDIGIKGLGEFKKTLPRLEPTELWDAWDSYEHQMNLRHGKW